MSAPPVLAREDQGRVRRLILNRPEKKNALSGELAGALVAALQEANADPGVGAVVLASTGDMWSAGVDVNVFLQIAAGQPAPDALVRLTHHLRAFEKPLIACVQGPTLGMGVTILPHFDLVYAGERATFGTPFVKLGLVLEYGSSFTLPRLIGRQRANELILRAKPISAATAADWGLVTRVFADDALDEEVLRIATDVAGAPAGAVAACKRLLLEGEETTLEAAVAAENLALSTRYGSAENVAAVTAILDKGKRS
ncbi:MAG: enoyl-CoA hydratase/isomerase family protein [Myxococcales bacterium]|nr:enoyl-CoA hydratase/isomerase family protein [Myxococcales bacterium]MCB9626369.1 enoyl-CoA hydratase/isomerase family protein [Sandaracinaceae bacterium]